MGLTQAEAERRLAQFAGGSSTKRGSDVLALLWNQLKSPLVLLLLTAMALSLFLGETTDALIVLAVVLGSTLLGFWQEYRAGNAVAKLMAVIAPRCRALRDAHPVEVAANTIVPGDVLLLRAGASIPADCLILDAKDVFVDESALTGESYPAEKSAGVVAAGVPLARRTNALFEGTHVVSGTATAVAVHTGAQTEFGAIRERLKLRPPETDFERGIRQFGSLLIKVTLVLVIAIFAINVYFQRPVVEAFLFALALAVGLTPELLPAIVSITLARGAQRMAQRDVIVKRLAAIENFGSMNVLCSDKTGTLTQGEVRLHAAIDMAGQPSERVLQLAVLNAVHESGFGNPIDDALRKLAVGRSGIAGFSKIDEVPYDFIRKRLSVVVANANATTHLMVTKGALANVLAVCVTCETPAGEVPISSNLAQIEAQFQQHSDAGLRVLGIATRNVTGDPIINKDDETGMTFVGMLLFDDPPKAGAQDAVRELAQLGVALKIITGDNQHVAATLGKHMGVARPVVLTGGGLHAMTDAALVNRVREVDIFAEIEPNQKERILIALRKAGYVVGYMGDGINDAAALHAADVGISVEGAVDVAKEAADIVLLKTDLGVLAQGVREGRRTFANTMKYIFITTSANFGNMFSMAGASLFLPFLPLLPKQILLNNFLSDLPSMTIATDDVDAEQIESPRKWDVSFIRNFMIVFGLVSSVFDFVAFGTLLLMLRASEPQFQTGWFIESLMTELLIVLVVRTRRPFLRSKPSRILLLATLAVAVLTLVLPYTGFGALFGLVPLPLPFMLVLMGISLAYVLASELAKRWFYGRFETLEARSQKPD